MNVELLQHQFDFLTAEEQFALLVGGIGSGKTFSGAHFVLDRIANEDSRVKGFIGANSYRQLTRSTLTGLFDELSRLEIPYDFNQGKGIIHIGQTPILCGTMHNYEIHRGIEIGWFWLDECRDMKWQAIEVLMGRLRDKNAKNLLGRFTSSPKGFNWMHEMFLGENRAINTKAVFAKTRDNVYLPEGYEKTLRSQYDSQMAAQELDAEIVNVGLGRIYYAFSRANNVKKIKRNPNLPIYIGMDFNRDPMTCTLANVTDKQVLVFDEFFIRDSNTRDMCSKIALKYGRTNIKIVPDATGKNITSSNAGQSDHVIIRQFFGENSVLTARNPFRMDRYNAVNKLLEDCNLLVDEDCVYTIRDLEQVSFQEGSNLPDTTDKLLGHVGDGLGYLVFRTHGIKMPHVSRTLQL